MVRPQARRPQAIRHATKASPRPPALALVEVTVSRLGARGDGVAESPHGLLFLPATVPGDRVLARPMARRGDGWASRVETLISAGEGRSEPPCPHFSTCGGCAAQHLAEPLYAAWKDMLLLEPLRRAGLDLPVPLPWRRAAPGSRRRVTLAVDGRKVGFNERASHALVDLETCTIATPRIVAILPHLRALGLPPADVTLLDTGAGLDLAIASRRPPPDALRRKIAGWAGTAGVQRAAWTTEGQAVEILALHAAPQIDLGGVNVTPAPGGFLQPTAGGEAALRGFVGEALGGAKRVVELFSGCGTFTFALGLAGARVQAFEGDGGAVAALNAAARAAGLAGRAVGVQRDLARQPLAPEELAKVDAVLLDPPRSGAVEQTDLLARSKVGRIVYVSCSPGSFARDVRLLADRGFRIARLIPVDQFLWSPHVELAALLDR